MDPLPGSWAPVHAQCGAAIGTAKEEALGPREADGWGQVLGASHDFSPRGWVLSGMCNSSFDYKDCRYS